MNASFLTQMYIFFQNKLMECRVDYWIAKNTIDLLIYPAWIIVSTS